MTVPCGRPKAFLAQALLTLLGVLGCQPQTEPSPPPQPAQPSAELRARGFIGMEFKVRDDAVPKGQAEQPQPPADPAEPQVVVIDALLPDGSADRAGMLVGDTLVSINGEAITRLDQVRNLVKSWQPPGPLAVVVRRGEREVKIDVPLMTWDELQELERQSAGRMIR